MDASSDHITPARACACRVLISKTLGKYFTKYSFGEVIHPGANDLIAMPKQRQ